MGFSYDQFRPAARAGLDKGHDGADIRSEARLRRTIEIWVRRHIRQPCAHEIAYGGHFFVVQRGVVANDHQIGILLVDGHARFLKLCQQVFIAQHESALARVALADERGSRAARGEDALKRNGKPHAFQPLLIELRVVRGIVGEKQVAPARVFQRADEFQRSWNDAAAQIKGAVHIQQKAFHFG